MTHVVSSWVLNISTVTFEHQTVVTARQSEWNSFLISLLLSGTVRCGMPPVRLVRLAETGCFLNVLSKSTNAISMFFR